MTQGAVYIARSKKGLFKIGATKVSSLKVRLEHVGQEAKAPVSLVRAFHVDHPRAIERVLHDIFAHLRVHGEWFILEDADIHWIHSLDDKCEKALRWRVAYKEIFDREREEWVLFRQTLQGNNYSRPAEDWPEIATFRIQPEPTLDWDKYTLPMPAEKPEGQRRDKAA